MPPDETYSQAMKMLKKYRKSGAKFDGFDAVDLMNKAADAGSVDAQYCIYLFSVRNELPDGYTYLDIKVSKEDGFANLEKAANSGHIDAIGCIALYYYEGYSDADGFRLERDFQKSYDYCQRLIVANDARGYILMGHFYEYGYIVPKDYDMAIKWYRKALNNGVIRLAATIADLYYRKSDYVNTVKMYDEYFKLSVKELGLEVLFADSNTRVLRWLEACFAIKDFDKAASIIEQCFHPKVRLKGSDIENWNLKKSDVLYGFEDMVETAYNKYGRPSKSPILQHIYSVDPNPNPEICYTRARKIISFNIDRHIIDREDNFRMALPWLEKGKAYKDELGQFTIWVGCEFMKDYNFDKAKEWFERAISYGEPMGYRLMAELYENPCDTAMASDPKMAFIYWKRFADTNDAYGLYTLGRYYMQGLASEQSIERAMEYFEKAANLETSKASLYAMDNLANCYIEIGDWEKAFYWLNKAYLKGFLDVCHNLGDLYYFGHGTGQSYAKAFEIFIKGANNGSSHCKYRVAEMLRSGLGTNIDYNKSNILLKEAADANVGQALYLLGMSYYSGDHIEQNFVMSIDCLNRALNDKFLPDAVRGEIYRTLSACYRFGRGVGVDIAKADEYTAAAVDCGAPDTKVIEDWLNGKY